MRVRRLAIPCLLLAVACGAGDGDGAEPSRDDGVVGWLHRAVERREPYELDDVTREVGTEEEVECDRESLTRYRGETVRYATALDVHPAFVERLKRFEAIVEEEAVEHYGRAPRRIQHAGAFACRTVRGRGDRLSEHALGNALDVTGFSFGRLPREESEPSEEQASAKGGEAPELPPRLRRPFRVSVREHWSSKDDEDAIHRQFLRGLTERLEEEDVFRGMIGPSEPGHRSHLHLDAGPYSYVRL